MPDILYSNPVDVISSKVFNVFDAFRVNPKLNNLDNSVQIILLFVTLYKYGLINDKNFGNNFSLSELNNIIIDSKLSNENKDTFFHIVNILSDSLSLVFSQPLNYLSFHLFHIDEEMLAEHFPSVVDDVIYRIAHAHGRYAGEFIQPVELTRFMNDLANLNRDSKVYNPFAGVASFGVNLDHSQNYFGQEFNPKTWVLGALRLMAYNKPVNSAYYCEDSILKWPNSSEKYDLIISNPPLGIRFGSQYKKDIESEFRTIEHFLIEKGVQSLKQEGKLITLLPQGFLYRGMQEQRLRESLIENDLIDTIIALPGGMLLNTGIPLIILIINKSKTVPAKVKFIDAKNFVKNVDSRLKVLDDKALINLIQNYVKDDNVIRVVDRGQIRSNNYNLSVARYFQEHIEGVKLREFLVPLRGQRGNLPEVGKLIRIRDLKDDNLDFTLDQAAIGQLKINRNIIHQIDESCLLLTMRWKTLKPTYFEFKGNPIYKNLDVFSAKVDEAKVDIAYLINELQSEYVKKQLDSYRLGATIPFIRQKDLLEVIIKLPSLEEQKAKVSGIIELSARFKQLEREKNILLSDLKKEETESSTSLSHILGKPLLSIGSSLEIIQNTLSREFPNWKDIMISESREFKMADAFDSISKNVKYIQELTDKNTSLISVSSFNLIELNFLKFISEFVKNERKSLNNNIELKLDIHEDIKQMTKQILIYGNEQKLKIVLINLIDNAKNHAFINKEINNEINIEILPFIGNEKEAFYLNYDIDNKKSYIEVKVSNTGKPFPKDFTLDDYIRKNFAVGNTRNRGLGGYEVNEIIKTHNEGKKALNLISFDGEQKYSSTISFLIPII